MGRIQSSIGLITGTDIAGTVDQLIALSARPRDRLVARNETLQAQQQALSELTAVVIGVQLAGNGLADGKVFRSTKATSSNPDAVSVSGGTNATPGAHVVRTLQTAATHSVRSLQRFATTDEPLGLAGTLTIGPGADGLDESLSLASLNGGRGVEAGVIRITDRSGRSADIDLTSARTVDDVLTAINDADLGVTARTVGQTFEIVDTTGRSDSNLIVEQLGSAETAADLGLWGINAASDSATGFAIELPEGATALRGVSLAELGGGNGLGSLGSLDITLADGSSASVDLSGASSTSEVIDAINASGLSVIAGLNDARNGFRLRDVSGGSGTFSVSSADGTAAAIGIEGSTDADILVGEDLNRLSITLDTPLSQLNQGNGIGSGSFTISDSAGEVKAINLRVDNIETVRDLVDAINGLGIGVTASLNDDGDGIAVVDTAGGSERLTIEDTGTGTAARDLGIAGEAIVQSVGGSAVPALVGTQSDRIEIAADDSLAEVVSKINDTGRYASAEIQVNEDGSFSLRLQSRRGGEAGQLAVNSAGVDLDLRTEVIGRDAEIALSTDGGSERILSSADGVFEIDDQLLQGGQTAISRDTPLRSLNDGAGVDGGSFTITDSAGAVAAVNLTAEEITTVGELLDAINSRNIGVTASLNDDGTGIAIVDDAEGSGTLKIEDTGTRTAAADLGIAGEATTQIVGGASVSALVGSSVSSDESSSGFSLTLKQLSDEPITVGVEANPEAAVTAVKTFVDQYNKLVEKLESLTFFDPETEEVGLLFGTSEALRIETGYKRLLSGVIRGAGSYRSIGQAGIRFEEDGKLELNEQALEQSLAAEPGAVESLFTTDGTGLADRLDELAERIAGASGGLLLNRSETLSARIERNSERVEALNDRLEAERERLLRQFFSMEEAIAKIQSNQQYISQIQPVTMPSPSGG